jgi:hypothetical protein
MYTLILNLFFIRRVHLILNLFFVRRVLSCGLARGSYTILLNMIIMSFDILLVWIYS